ncbi:MAG: cadherin-like beta sandwich domain-containing protein [Deltaproteobacteria bacterium]|nr:cadherin-like beta sandwich domain-containing protein [Deltaproteobacteria bacterium]
MRVLIALAALLVGGCGRIGFDPTVDATGPGDPSARLASITLWSAPVEPLTAPLSPGFDPQIASYATSVGLALQSVRVSAIPIDPTTTITIEGAPVAAAILSAPVPLDLGSTVITVTGTSRTGARATYTIDITRAGQLAQDVYLKASNTEGFDNFGVSVALSGDTLAVGASGESSSATGVGGDQADNAALDSGAVYAFTRTGSAWSQQAYLKASNTGVFDEFGWSIAVSGDTLAVGASGEDSSATGVDGNQADNTAGGSGAAYVFTRTGPAWSQRAYLKASNTEGGDLFGRSVALSGNTLVVVASLESSNATGIDGNQADNTAGGSGAAYVFTRAGPAWSQQAYLKASNTDTGDSFGRAIALSGDALVVGAQSEGSSATGVGGDQADNAAVQSGAGYVFR